MKKYVFIKTCSEAKQIPYKRILYKGYLHNIGFSYLFYTTLLYPLKDKT